MQSKKLALISILAIILLGCIFSAGCTYDTNYSYSSTNTETSADGTITTTVNDNGKITKTTININDLVGTWKLDFDDAYAERLKKINPELTNKLLTVVDNLSDISSILILNKDKTVTGKYVLKSTGEQIAHITAEVTWEPVTATSVCFNYQDNDPDTYNYDPVTKTLSLPDLTEIYKKVEGIL